MQNRDVRIKAKKRIFGDIAKINVKITDNRNWKTPGEPYLFNFLILIPRGGNELHRSITSKNVISIALLFFHNSIQHHPQSHHLNTLVLVQKLKVARYVIIHLSFKIAPESYADTSSRSIAIASHQNVSIQYFNLRVRPSNHYGCAE